MHQKHAKYNSRAKALQTEREITQLKCYRRANFNHKNSSRLYAYQGNMAGVCFGPATRPPMLQYYPRWKASSTQRTSVVMYGVLLESSLAADWSNVPRVILDMH